MIRLSILMLSSVLLFAQNYESLSYEGSVHYEVETTKGHSVNPEQPLPRKVFYDEQQHLSVFYSVLGYTLQSNENRWALTLEGRANVQLNKQEYSTPVYIQKFAFEDINTALLSAASIDYYADTFALSIGRNVVDMDWLSGSIDTVMAYGITDALEARAFWFKNYYDLRYNYFVEHEEINDGKGISAFYLQSGEALRQWQLSAYGYLVTDRRYLLGATLHTSIPPFSLSASYSSSDTIHAPPGKELFGRISGDYALSDAHRFEVGYSKTGSNGLTAMLQLGSHPFSVFYLSNALDRPKAQNGYVKYSYESRALLFECIGGITSYYGTALQSSRLTRQMMNSYEIDLTLTYTLDDHFAIELGYMVLNLDRQDILEFDQNLLMAALVVQWP